MSSLYGGFTVSLPAKLLFDPTANKIVLHGTRNYSDPPTDPLDSGTTASTQISWTITLTRIAHKQFPLAQ